VEIMRALLVSGLLAAALTTTGGAQQQPATFARWTPHAAGEFERGSAPDIERVAAAGDSRDYRYEGLVVGGLAIGAFGAWVGSQITLACPIESGSECGTDKLGTAVALGLVGAAIGGGLGYLVGRLSPKSEPVLPGTDLVPQ
jgi:hypothetical protein